MRFFKFEPILKNELLTPAKHEETTDIFSDHADWIFPVDSIFAQCIVDKMFLSPIVVLTLEQCAWWSIFEVEYSFFQDQDQLALGHKMRPIFFFFFFFGGEPSFTVTQLPICFDLIWFDSDFKDETYEK